MNNLILTLHLVLYALMLTASQVLMKLGLQSMAISTSITRSLLNALLTRTFLIGLSLQLLCVIYWLFLLKSNKLSLMFPIASSVAFAAITISSSLLLNENISPRLFLGTFIIVAGIVIVATAGN